MPASARAGRVACGAAPWSLTSATVGGMYI